MSSGTNIERLNQNNDLLTNNNSELTNLKTIIQSLPIAIDTSDATATSNDIVYNKTAYVNGEKITGSLSESTGVGFMDSTQGYWSYSYEGNYLKPKCHTNSRMLLALRAAVEMYLPFAEVASFIGLTPDKLAVGNTILGVVGTNAGLDTSDATATASDILINKTAYVNGEKITGTIVKIEENWYNTAESLINDPNNENHLMASTTINTAPIYLATDAKLQLGISYTDIVNTIGLLPGQIVEGNTILGVQGTATELNVTKTEIYDTTNNNIIVSPDDLVLYKNQGVIGFRVNVPSSITQKEQILISGTGYIELQSSVQSTGCLCARLNSKEELETYAASDGEYVIVINETNNYLGTYCYTAGAWSEVVSSTAYDNTLTETEYDEAVETTHTILGTEEVNL